MVSSSDVKVDVVSNAGKILGIYPKDWARITAILLTLYVCLGMIYWGLLEAGVHVRGTDWLTLSGRFYGKFIENTQPAVPDHEYDVTTMVDKKWSFPPWTTDADLAAAVKATIPVAK